MSLSDIVTRQLKKELNEKSESKAQRHLMGWVYACQKGEASSCPPRIKKIGKSMSSSETRKFAKTKEKGLPEKKHPEKDIRNEATEDDAWATTRGTNEGITLTDLDSEGILGEASDLATTSNKEVRPDAEWEPRFEDQPDDAGDPEWQEPKADWNSIEHRDSMHGLIKQTLNPDMEDRAYKSPDPSKKIGRPQIKTVKYNEAIRIEHPLKGRGTVISLSEGRAVVEWDRLDLRPLGPEVLTKEQAQWVSVIREEYATDPEEAEMAPRRKKKRNHDDEDITEAQNARALTIIVNARGDMWCRDRKWREHAVFGTVPSAVAVYKSPARAAKTARRIRGKIISIPSDDNVERRLGGHNTVIERTPAPDKPGYERVKHRSLDDFVVVDYTRGITEDQYKTQPSVQVGPPPSTTIFQDQETDDDWDPEPLATQRGADAAPEGDAPEGEMEEPDDAPGDLDIDQQELPDSKRAERIAGKVFKAFSGEGGDHSEIDYKDSQASYERQDDDSQNRTDREPEEGSEDEEDNEEESKERAEESLSLVDFDVEGILG